MRQFLLQNKTSQQSDVEPVLHSPICYQSIEQNTDVWLFLDMCSSHPPGHGGLCLGPDPVAYSVRPSGWRVWPLASPPGLDIGQLTDKTCIKTPGRQRCLLAPLHHWLPCTQARGVAEVFKPVSGWGGGHSLCLCLCTCTVSTYWFLSAHKVKSARRGCCWTWSDVRASKPQYGSKHLFRVLFQVTLIFHSCDVCCLLLQWAQRMCFGLHGRAQRRFLRDIDAGVSNITYCVN